MLADSCNLDTARYNLGIHVLPTVLIQPGFVVIDLARVNLAKEWHHLGVQHGCEQVRVQSGVTKTFLEPIAFGVTALGVHLGLAEFFLTRRVVPELRHEGAVDVNFVGQDEKHGGYGGDPLEGAKAVL